MTDQSNPNQSALPLNYRKEDTEYVFRQLFAGESCSLVGVGSVGKSNLLQLLVDERIKRQYLGDYTPYTLMVLLDPHKIIHLQERALHQAGNSWPGYEIMLSRLRRAVTELDNSGGLVERIEKLYLNLFKDQPLLVQSGIRHLEEAIFEVMRLGPYWKIAFLFDEFEGFAGLKPEFFESLRGVRDEFKNRVMFLTASRLPLRQMYPKNDQKKMEGFLELLDGHVRYLGPLDEESARTMLRRQEDRYQQALEPANRRNLLDATGRHAGLMRKSFPHMLRASSSNGNLEQLCYYLLHNSGVRQECGTLLESLIEIERICLWHIARGQQHDMDEEVELSLKAKFLLKDSMYGGAPTVTVPLLYYYLRDLQQPPADEPAQRA